MRRNNGQYQHVLAAYAFQQGQCKNFEILCFGVCEQVYVCLCACVRAYVCACVCVCINYADLNCVGVYIYLLYENNSETVFTHRESDRPVVTLYG